MKRKRILQDQFEVVITGEGINVTRTIDADRLALLLPIVVGSTARSSTSDFDAEGTGPPQQKKEVKETLREYLDEIGAITNIELIVAITHYFWVHQDKREFSMDDVRSQFLSAHEKLPGNLPRDFKAAANKGMIAPVHGKADYYYITKNGIRAVEDRKAFTTKLRARNNR